MRSIQGQKINYKTVIEEGRVKITIGNFFNAIDFERNTHDIYFYCAVL